MRKYLVYLPFAIIGLVTGSLLAHSFRELKRAERESETLDREYDALVTRVTGWIKGQNELTEQKEYERWMKSDLGRMTQKLPAPITASDFFRTDSGWLAVGVMPTGRYWSSTGTSVAAVDSYTGKITPVYPGITEVCASEPIGCGVIEVVRQGNRLAYKTVEPGCYILGRDTIFIKVGESATLRASCTIGRATPYWNM